MRNLSRLIGFSFGLISVKSGFNRDDEWGYRACEPQRNVISSMALVLLKTGINHREDNKEGPPEIDPVQMGTAQKLLLFWRKPAVWMLSSMICDDNADQEMSCFRENAGGTLLKLMSLVVWIPSRTRQ